MTCSSGRPRRRRGRRRCAGRRRSCRGAASRWHDRVPEPCRTHRQHAVVAGAGKRARQLAAPGGGRAELLVQPGDVDDVVVVADLLVSPQLLVEPAQWGSLIAGDQGGGGEVLAAVGAVLIERQPHQALHAGQQDAAFLEQVLVGQADLGAGGPAAAASRLAPGPWRRRLAGRSRMAVGVMRARNLSSRQRGASALGKATLPMVVHEAQCEFGLCTGISLVTPGQDDDLKEG